MNRQEIASAQMAALVNAAGAPSPNTPLDALEAGFANMATHAVLAADALIEALQQGDS